MQTIWSQHPAGEIAETCFGNFNQSLLDHIFVPRAFIPTFKSTGPLYGLGKRLQAVPKHGLFDHTPVHCTMLYLLAHPTTSGTLSPQSDLVQGIELKDIKWCRDKLMAGLHDGKDRHDFIQLLETEVEAFI